jgi:hypothetical protein
MGPPQFCPIIEQSTARAGQRQLCATPTNTGDVSILRKRKPPFLAFALEISWQKVCSSRS